MTLAELEEGVMEAVQDDSFAGSVRRFINQGVLWVAGAFKLTTLDASDVVTCTADAGSVALPANYMHGLYWVDDGIARIGDPVYYHDFARFQRYHPDLTLTGRLRDVAVKGRMLYYADRDDKELTIRFFETPQPLVNGSDVPDFLPEHLQEPILVNYAASRIFNLIEDGIEDAKTNTKIYNSLLGGAVSDLGMFTVNTDSPAYIQSEDIRVF